MAPINQPKCYLHIPHKEWANEQGDDRELQNYLRLERWVRDYLRRYRTFRSTQFTPLTFPFKDFSSSPLELENYMVIERWVYQQVPASLGQVKTSFSRYDLHIPNKDWALDRGQPGVFEQENYMVIERWAYLFIRSCLPVGTH